MASQDIGMLSTQQVYSQMSQDDNFESAAGMKKTTQQINREARDSDTEDAPLFEQPEDAIEYKNMEHNLVNDFFDEEDCRKIVRTLDILHSTLAKCLTDKKNIKNASFITSLQQNRTLINYLNEKVRINEDYLLHEALFDSNGNGIIIWIEDNGKLKLAQLVNPKHNETIRLEGVTTKKGVIKKPYQNRFSNRDLTIDANNWMLERNVISSSSSGAASSSNSEFKAIKIKDFLKSDGEEDEPKKKLIFDLITITKEGEMKFSLTAGEINISKENHDAVIFVGDRKPHDPIFNLNDHTSLYPDFFHQVRYLPFFQVYNRDLKVGNYKPTEN